jgi:hypothetical protein
MKAKHEFPYKEDYKEYLKTYFAGLAMQGLCATPDKGTFSKIEDFYIKTAEHSIKIADELLKQLEQ